MVNTGPRVIQLSCFHQWEVYICVNGPIISLDNCRPAFVYRIQKLTKYQTLTHSFKSMPRSYVQIMTWFIYKQHKLSFGNHFYCNRKKIVGCIKLLCNWTGCLLGNNLLSHHKLSKLCILQFSVCLKRIEKVLFVCNKRNRFVLIEDIEGKH